MFRHTTRPRRTSRPASVRRHATTEGPGSGLWSRNVTKKSFPVYLHPLAWHGWTISVFLCSHGTVRVQYFSMVCTRVRFILSWGGEAATSEAALWGRSSYCGSLRPYSSHFGCTAKENLTFTTVDPSVLGPVLVLMTVRGFIYTEKHVECSQSPWSTPQLTHSNPYELVHQEDPNFISHQDWSMPKSLVPKKDGNFGVRQIWPYRTFSRGKNTYLTSPLCTLSVQCSKWFIRKCIVKWVDTGYCHPTARTSWVCPGFTQANPSLVELNENHCSFSFYFHVKSRLIPGLFPSYAPQRWGTVGSGNIGMTPKGQGRLFSLFWGTVSDRKCKTFTLQISAQREQSLLCLLIVKLAWLMIVSFLFFFTF